MLVLLFLGTLGYFATERVQTTLEKNHKHVTLTFLDGNLSQRNSCGPTGGGSLFSHHQNMTRQYIQNNGEGVFNISCVFESSI